MSTKFTVFFSWQSDSDRSTNWTLISQSLALAASELTCTTKHPDLHVSTDEATRDEIGSPNIPETILRKIASCDAFVCDVTTINPNARTRKVPNPNVVYELGYAVAMLGWQRVVLLFNESIGTFPDDLPFDFDRHRAKRYKARPVNSKEAKRALDAAKTDLTEFFVEALRAIIDINPAQPDWRTTISPEEVKRRRDLDTLKLLLLDFPVDEIDRHIESLPRKVDHSIFHFWEGFHATWNSSLTHVYDSDLQSILREIHDSWEETLSHGEYYGGGNHISYFWQGNSVGQPDQEVYKRIQQASLRLKHATTRLTKMIHNTYLEIDLNESTKAAWEDYHRFRAEHFSDAKVK